MTRSVLALLTVLALSALQGTHAQTTGQPPLTGDAAAGQTKAVLCAACHGPDGNSDPGGEIPHLAAQVPGYIAAQLARYQSGERQNPIMLGLAAALSPQDMADLDAYFSTQTPQTAAITAEQTAAALAGQRLFRAGQADYNIPACMGCHGPAGHGVQPHFPRLAGQPMTYIAAQLHAFKSGQRVDPMMNRIAHPLTAQQIEQLATYLAGLN